MPDGMELCRPTGIAQVYRCQGEEVRDMCLADGEECATPDECCGGICVPDAMGVLRCGAMCIEDGGACTRDADCCGGYCTDGVCAEPVVMCLPLGADCTEDGECCSGYCDPEFMVCSTTLI